MGLFWDLYQQSQIQNHVDRTDSVENRVVTLEGEVERLSGLVRDLIGRLEDKLGEDIDGDGRVG